MLKASEGKGKRMTRGTNDRDFEFAIAQLYGQINIQIQQFAATVGVQASRIAERLSELLSPERERVFNHMSAMRVETTGVHRTMESMEMVVNAHSGKTPLGLEAGRETRKANSHRKVGPRSYWAALTPEQRSKEMRKRMKKWKPESRARWSKPAKDAKTKSRVDPAKQRVYQARAAAKKRGESLPPLPKELAAAVN